MIPPHPVWVNSTLLWNLACLTKVGHTPAGVGIPERKEATGATAGAAAPQMTEREFMSSQREPPKVQPAAPAAAAGRVVACWRGGQTPRFAEHRRPPPSLPS